MELMTKWPQSNIWLPKLFWFIFINASSATIKLRHLLVPIVSWFLTKVVLMVLRSFCSWVKVVAFAWRSLAFVPSFQLWLSTLKLKNWKLWCFGLLIYFLRSFCSWVKVVAFAWHSLAFVPSFQLWLSTPKLKNWKLWCFGLLIYFVSICRRIWEVFVLGWRWWRLLGVHWLLFQVFNFGWASLSWKIESSGALVYWFTLYLSAEEGWTIVRVSWPCHF